VNDLDIAMKAPLVDIYLTRFSSNLKNIFVCIGGSKNQVDARCRACRRRLERVGGVGCCSSDGECQ
jgi:hypothetical protein